jgi:hypothetical protein
MFDLSLTHQEDCVEIEALGYDLFDHAFDLRAVTDVPVPSAIVGRARP